VNYYRWFIKGFSKIATPLNNLTRKEPGAARKGQAIQNEESRPITLGLEAKEAFRKSKDSFLDVPILSHYDPKYPSKVETDASGRAICGILSQLVPVKGDKLA
jgi:hypothetical protein